MSKRVNLPASSEPDHTESGVRVISGPRSKLFHSQPNMYARDFSAHGFKDVERQGSRILRRVDACYKIKIPDESGFSFKKVWAFTGPGFLMSVAYLDPGNIESDVKIGTAAEYKLLWVLLGSTITGILMQRLAVRLGVVTGMDLAEMCHLQYRTVPRIILWIMIEITIIGADMQEVIGTAIAIYMLSHAMVPIWAGVLITIADTLTFLTIDKFGLRKLEALFGLQIALMGVCFGYQFFSTTINPYKLMLGMFMPWCEDCDDEAIWEAVGVIGAVAMPQSLFLHSAMVKTRDIDRTKRDKIKDANIHFFVEAIIALLISFMINVFVVSVFAQGLYHHTNNEVRELCEAQTGVNGSIFPANDDPVHADIYIVGIFIACKYGPGALYIWAVGLYAAGQSATMSGVFSGQFVMEGFLNLTWPRWKRVLFTRSIAIVPTFFLAFFRTIRSLTAFLHILDAIMAVQLPFATIPLIAFTSNPLIMGDFSNSLGHKIVTVLFSLFLTSINVYFVTVIVRHFELQWYYLLLITTIGTLYAAFCIYLIIHMAVSMGNTSLLRYGVINRYVMNPEEALLYNIH